jgi:2-dehydro-3-deoxy-D-arabinonate dehydratase
MNLCRFKRNGAIGVGLVTEDSAVIDFSAAGVTRLTPLLEDENSVARVGELSSQRLPRLPLAEVQLLPPVEEQEVWAAGVTYRRSKTARMEESDFSATAYDKVYSAERPELFFKSLAHKVVGPGEPVGIRKDATWSVPEPELALVLNSKGSVVGCTIGNDMSSRDIEGQNLLYLPQAKVYSRSCSLGPWITIGAVEAAVREWTIRLAIKRDGRAVFMGETSVGQLKRGFEELAHYLFRSQDFPHGAVLLTGTGIVPPESFTLRPNDAIEIEISGVGSLCNSVIAV